MQITLTSNGFPSYTTEEQFKTWVQYVVKRLPECLNYTHIEVSFFDFGSSTSEDEIVLTSGEPYSEEEIAAILGDLFDEWCSEHDDDDDWDDDDDEDDWDDDDEDD